MTIVDATRQVEGLRSLSLAASETYAVQSMAPPSFLQALLSDHTKADSIIFIYKLSTKTSTASLPISFDPEEKDTSVDLDLTGQPLECPFGGDEFEDTITFKRQQQWSKSEMNMLPLLKEDALRLLNAYDFDRPLRSVDEEGNKLLDVWVLNDGGRIIKSAEKSKFLNGSLNGSHTESTNFSNGCIGDVSALSEDGAVPVLQASHATDGWWTRTVVKAQGSCSLAAQGMNPIVMKENHIEIAKISECRMKAHATCRYVISGQRITPDVNLNLSSIDSASSVVLELEWHRLSVAVPLQEARTNVVVQVGVGHRSSPSYALWKQLQLLQELLNVLVNCWRDKTAPQNLPHSQPEWTENVEESPSPPETLEKRLYTLIKGGGMALHAQSAGSRVSLAPALLKRQSVAAGLLGRQSMAPGFLGRMSVAPLTFNDGGAKESNRVVKTLPETVDLAVTGLRENTDTTDQLWMLLSECKTYEELTQAWTMIFGELSQGHSRPYVRPKNGTTAATLIQGLVTGRMENGPDLWQIKGSGVLQPLELLLELGLEKLSTDFYYIFLDSELVGRDALHAPEMPKSGLGISRDKWLTRCGHLLGWLAQVYTALEIMLPLQKTLPNETLTSIAPIALKYFQSEQSPVRSVANLSSNLGCWHDFRCLVNTKDVQSLLTDKFDWWRLTLTTESERRKVQSVFLRSCVRPLFPPQIYESEAVPLESDHIEDVLYHCVEATTISDML